MLTEPHDLPSQACLAILKPMTFAKEEKIVSVTYYWLGYQLLMPLTAICRYLRNGWLPKGFLG